MSILLLGAQGQLGFELGAALAPLGPVTALTRQQADLSRLDELSALINKLKPKIIVNAAAYTQVDQAETEAELAQLINAEAPARLASLAAELEAWLVHYSTDYVFDGHKEGPYTEEDSPAPLNVYGRSKAAGDQAIIDSGCRHLIFRTSWVYGLGGRNFPKTILELARRDTNLHVVDDQYGSPTSVELLSAGTALALQKAIGSEEDLSGLYNLVSSGYTNWNEYARHVIKSARELGWGLLAEPQGVLPLASSAGERPARRPANSRLSVDKFSRAFHLTVPDWTYYVDRFLWAWTKIAKPAPPTARIIGRKPL